MFNAQNVRIFRSRNCFAYLVPLPFRRRLWPPSIFHYRIAIVFWLLSITPVWGEIYLTGYTVPSPSPPYTAVPQRSTQDSKKSPLGPAFRAKQDLSARTAISSRPRAEPRKHFARTAISNRPRAEQASSLPRPLSPTDTLMVLGVVPVCVVSISAENLDFGGSGRRLISVLRWPYRRVVNTPRVRSEGSGPRQMRLA